MENEEMNNLILRSIDTNNIKQANDITKHLYAMSIIKYCILNNQTDCLFKSFSKKIGYLDSESRLKLFKLLLDNSNNVCCRLAAGIYYNYLHDYDSVHTPENDDVIDVEYQIQYLVLIFGDNEENVPKRKLNIKSKVN